MEWCAHLLGLVVKFTNHAVDLTVPLSIDSDIWFEQKFNEHMEKREADRTPSMSIIVTKGTLDWAYPPFILAATAAALEWEVTLFFTFYGLELLKKKLALKVSPLGNPGIRNDGDFIDEENDQKQGCRLH